jgi:hypothetical protein
MSRRHFLRRGGGLLVATTAATFLPVGGLEKLDRSAIARRSLRKCVSLGGPGPLREEKHPDDYRYWGNREFIRDSSGTKWVKLWVSWFDLQQELEATPDGLYRSWDQLNSAPGGQSWLRRLDRQLRAINDDRLGTILTLYHAFPTWSSGADAHDPVSGDKPPEAKLPVDLSPTGPWGWFIAHLCARYRKGAARNRIGPHEPSGEENGEGVRFGNPDGAWIDALEVCNEPNLLFWPQEGIELAVTEMIRSAARLSKRWGGPAILAPATSDFPDHDHDNERGLVATEWRGFTRRVLDGLVGFRPPVPVYWSHHNFQDVKHADVPSRAEQVIELLRSKGWTTHRQPLWLTEGGYDMHPNERDALTREDQARLIEGSFRRMRRVGDVYVWTQHTITDKQGNDFKSGLRDDFVDGRGPGARRPAWRAWRDLVGSAEL